MKNNTQNEIINAIYNLILDKTISDFEREKLLIAKELLENEDNNYFYVLRRIQVTFMARSLRGENSEKFNEFYSKLLSVIGLEMKNQATSTPLGGIFATPQPL